MVYSTNYIYDVYIYIQQENTIICKQLALESKNILERLLVEDLRILCKPNWSYSIGYIFQFNIEI